MTAENEYTTIEKQCGCVVIRRAQETDIGEIVALERNTSATAWSEASIRYDVAENERATVLVAAADEVIVAYTDAWAIAGELQLNNIAVDYNYRRRHIAEQLLHELIRVGGESCETINLEVRQSNVAAIALYRKLGFEAVGERPNYYEDNGETAILMDKSI